eukprot:NODE_5121_length_731_cov_19.804985_g4303_i0.p1 GENE.NODE_5121_length_731_cov_19.804985_g4303_i0~~NODE_5121_length_731_cov_19.804985_g4303_i0.p1  ORF type:complete len:188 (+),score=44.61 NODE_5121_length_731_cov_19.804985_g4303_i0:102-665(+)
MNLPFSLSLLVGQICSVVAFLFIILSMATPWAVVKEVIDSKAVTKTYGWAKLPSMAAELQKTHALNSICVSSVNSLCDAVVAFTVLGMVVALISIILDVFAWIPFFRNWKGDFWVGSLVFLILTSMFSMIAFTCFAGLVDNDVADCPHDGFKPDVGIAFSILAFLVSLGGTIASVALKHFLEPVGSE